MSTKQATPPTGKVPLDFYLWLRDIGTNEFAEAVGVGAPAISRLRTQGGKPRDPELRRKIARKLKVSQADLGWTNG